MALRTLFFASFFKLIGLNIIPKFLSILSILIKRFKLFISQRVQI